MTLLAAPTDPRRLLAWPRDLRLNPMPAMLYDGMQRIGWQVSSYGFWRGLFGRDAVLHISFPNDVFRNRSRLLTLVRYLLALGAIQIAKRRGRRVVWTVHNLADHEGFHPRLETRFMGRFTALVDFVIHMSDAGRIAAEKRYPHLAEKPATLIPHPRYRTPAGPAIPRDATLRALGLPGDCEVILAFGVVRRYKNLLKLMQAFADLPGANRRLVIAGFPLDTGVTTTIRRLADDRIIPMLHAIPDAEVAALFRAATVVVAPYLDILNSGTAFLSLSHGRPVLVPKRGAMAELQDQVGKDWVKLFDAPLTPLLLADALRWAAAPRDVAPDLTPFAPERIAGAYDRALTALI
jgi:glycosyltransferase involved in cell wall biosynthesis